MILLMPHQTLKNIDYMFETLFDNEIEIQTLSEIKGDDGQNETLIMGLTEFKKTTPPIFAVLPSTVQFSGKNKKYMIQYKSNTQDMFIPMLKVKLFMPNNWFLSGAGIKEKESLLMKAQHLFSNVGLNMETIFSEDISKK